MSEMTKNMWNSVLGYLYDVLMAGDNTPKDKATDFISWNITGAPYPEEEFDFLLRGLVPTSDSDGKAFTAQSDGVTDLATEEPELVAQAQNFADMMDFIPNPQGIFSGERRMNAVSGLGGPKLSAVYKEVLDNCEIAQPNTDPEETLKKIEKLKKLLKKEETTIVGIDENLDPIYETSLVDNEIVEKYDQYQEEYETAILQRNAKRLAAMARVSQEAQLDWMLNGHVYTRQVQRAMRNWVGKGYKNIYEQIMGILGQYANTNLNDMVNTVYKVDMDTNLISEYQNTVGSFYYTRFPSSNFTKGKWAEFSWSSQKYEYSYDRTKTSWGAGGGLSIGFFSIGGGGSVTTEKIEEDINWENISIKAEIASLPLVRYWFHPEFLTSKFWRYPAAFGDQLLSNGAMPPEGRLPAYPATVIFARNVRISFKTHSQEYDRFDKAVKAGGGLRVGPFRFGGSYSKDETKVDFKSEGELGTYTSPDMQIIGFKCNLLPLSPDPATGVNYI